MKTKSIASTAKKRANKKAVIVAMAALTGSTFAQECAAMQKAMQDMRDEMGKDNVYSVNYVYNPFEGLYA